MLSRILHVGALALLLPASVLAQGRQTKVYYDETIAFGSQALRQTRTHYFQVLTTPAPEDPTGEIFGYWGPKLDSFYESVCENLQLSRAEVFQYLLYPQYFGELEKLVLQGKLHRAGFDSILARTVAVVDRGAPLPPQPLVLVDPLQPPAAGAPTPVVARTRRWPSRYIETSGDTLFVWLPDAAARNYQRVILYRTLHDFLATSVGPPIPEGVLGFVPRHDPSLPVVIYASLGEHQLRRTAQHEIAHAVVESIARYLRAIAPVRNRYAAKDSTARQAWRPSQGGFSAITHENYAEYLAFPPGQMEPALRAALIEMVAENRLDGLAAISVGARTLASSYIEGPARLVFLADTFGRDMPKKLLIGYYTNTSGFLGVLEDLTGHNLGTLEQLYRRWLREWLWGEYLATGVPDTVGSVLAGGLSAVRRGNQVLVERARGGQMELVVRETGEAGRSREVAIVRDLDGIDHLPLFSTPDLRDGRVVASVRRRNEESLLLWDEHHGRRIRRLRELGAVREVRDPRWSPSGRVVVFRVVDRSGRNAIGCLDVESDRARLVVPWLWAELNAASFAENDSLVVFTSTATATPEHTSDIFLLNLRTERSRNLTQTADVNELEPVVVHGHLVCLSDATEVPVPIEILPGGDTRTLLSPPFAVSRMQAGDSTLALVAASLRHRALPAGRAVWEFPYRKLGLAVESDAVVLCTPPAPAAPDVAAAEPTPEGLPGVPVTSPDGSSTPLMPPTPLAPSAQLAASSPLASAQLASSAQLAASQQDTTSVQVAAHTGTLVGPGPAAPVGPALADGALEPVTLSPYKQKWRLMPLGLSLFGSNSTARGATFIGFDSEFHDRAIFFAAGKSGDFDRFGMVQYQNRAARTHWQVSGFHREMLVTRYQQGPSELVHSNETEEGMLFSAQYHKSLVTRFGFGMSAGWRTDAQGNVVAREQETTVHQAEAPILALQMPQLQPQSWNFAVAGVPEPELFNDRSPTAMARWAEAGRELAAQRQEFLPSEEYVRPNLEVGIHLSRDTRVWTDARGPRSGTLLLLGVSTGFNAPGTRRYMSSTQADSTQQDVAGGLDRVALTALLATHRRLGPIDFAFRGRALANDGPGAYTYGLGGIATLSGLAVGTIRAQQVAYANVEARMQFLDYNAIRLPIRFLPVPATDGFLFMDSGVGANAPGITTYGVGLRLRYGFMAFEWRHPLRSGLDDQRGLLLTW